MDYNGLFFIIHSIMGGIRKFIRHCKTYIAVPYRLSMGVGFYFLKFGFEIVFNPLA